MLAQSWNALGQQIDLDESGSKINCLYNDGDSVLYVGGKFVRSEEGTTISKIARWDGHALLPVGCGFNWDCANPDDLNAYDGNVSSIVRFHDQLYAGGYFQNSGQDTLFNVAKFNGATWESVGAGFDFWVNRLVVIEDTLYACGEFSLSGTTPINGLAKWNESEWVAVHDLPQFGTFNANNVSCIAKYNNSIYVTGNFSQDAVAFVDCAFWNGTEWDEVDEGFFGGLMALGEMGIYDGELIITGAMSQDENSNNPGNGIVGWNGSQWNSFQEGTDDPTTTYTGTVYDMTIYDDRIYVVGNFYYAGGVPANQLAFWEVDHWCTFHDVTQISNEQTNIRVVEVFKDTLYIAGPFDGISGNSTIHGIAKYIGGDICEITPVRESEVQNVFGLYPNPTSTQINIVSSAIEFIVRITDNSGRVILESKNSKQIDVSSFASGLYILSYQDGESSSAISFVKQ